MKERPILFSAPMVHAILDGRKTQTRRLNGLEDANKQPDAWCSFVIGEIDYMAKKSAKGKYGATFKSFSGAIQHRTINFCPQVCPYGKPGDRLWVRESTKEDNFGSESFARYSADDKLSRHAWWYSRKTCPSIHMPRCASRLLLEIVNVRVERLQDISEKDAIAEGLKAITKDGRTIKYGIPDRDGYPGNDNHGWHWCDWNVFPAVAYKKLWESINGPGSWDLNPLVWVVEFKKIQG